mmetsp:Transcript_7682/g.11630  ORF Transcript_7682/g.11630 Transcript_7682/m.11630 type:complete len:277 (-) Transcript_7682:65-895(-)
MKKIAFFFIFVFLVHTTNASFLKWSEQNGAEFVKMSYAAYCPQNSIQKWNCKWCSVIPDFSVQLVVDNRTHSDVLGYVGFSHKQQLIAAVYRGSSNLRNWIDNLEYTKIPYSLYGNGAEVHHGFYKAYESLSGSMVPEVEKLHERYPSYSVVVSGHSLGAAVATFLTAELQAKGIVTNPIQYDYGRPRVGNKQFATQFGNRISSTYRHVNNRDIVPTLPPESFGFHHSVEEIWERPKCVFHQCSDLNGEDPKCSDSLEFRDSVEDHLNYFEYHESC